MTPALCDCPERGLRVAAIQWQVLVDVPAVLSWHTLENGPPDATEEVPGGMYDGETFCCDGCFWDVYDKAAKEAVKGSLWVRLLPAQDGQVVA